MHLSSERHKVCPRCGKETGLQASVCSRCGRRFKTRFVTTPSPQAETPQYLPPGRTAKRRSAKSIQRKGHAGEPESYPLVSSSQDLAAVHTDHEHSNGYKNGFTRHDAPARSRRTDLSFETAASGSGLEHEVDAPFWADDPPPPPKRNFFKSPSEEYYDENEITQRIVIRSRTGLRLVLPVAVLILFACLLVGYKLAKRISVPRFDPLPAAVVGNWVSDDELVTVEMKINPGGTGRVTWHVHGAMPAGFSNVGTFTCHWQQNRKSQLIIKEDTPLDKNTLYPPGLIESIANHSYPTWAADHVNDALTLTWAKPESTSITFTGAP